MNNQVRQVYVRAVLPVEGSFALFLGNEEKTFVIHIDESVGGAISMFMQETHKERPLTHDLMATILMAFGAKVERVVINDMNESVFYARLILSAENQLQNRKLIELDARPSDSVALAVQQGAPIYVADSVWYNTEDVTSTLDKIEQESQQGEESEEEDDDEDDDADLDALFGTDEEDEEEDDDDLFDEDEEDEDDDEEFDFDDDDSEDEDDEDEEDDSNSRS